MTTDLLDLYRRASDWTLGLVAGAKDQLDAPTPCDEWNVRQLMNHMLDTQRYFTETAAGEQSSPPSPTPPELLGDDPVASFERGRDRLVEAFSPEGVIEKTGIALGAAFGDQLFHGWDLARATRQDDTMPPGLADAAYEIVHGRFNADNRKGIFKPELPVPDDASVQDKLLAYSGRHP